MKKLLLVVFIALICMFVSIPAFADDLPLSVEWKKELPYNGSDVSISATDDGGFIMVYNGNKGTYNGCITKYDFNGNKQWSSTLDKKIINGKILQDKEGGYLALVEWRLQDKIIYGPAYRKSLYKLDSKGNILWDKLLGEFDFIFPYPLIFYHTSDNGLITTAGGPSSSIIKYNSSYEKSWEFKFADKNFLKPGTYTPNNVQKIIETTDGYICVGSSDTPESKRKNLWVFKLDKKNGKQQWSKLIGDIEPDGGESGIDIIPSADGGYLIIGDAGYPSPPNQNLWYGLELFVVKIDDHGNRQWYKKYREFYYGVGIFADTSGGYIIGGNSCNENCYLMKIDANGNKIWSKDYIDIQGDILEGILQTKDGGYLFVDSTYARTILVKIKPKFPAIFVEYNGLQLSFDQPPIMKNNSVLIPIRDIAEKIGAKVTWDNGVVVISKDNKVLSINLNINQVTLNGKSIELDVPAQIINGRYMVPLRFISEALGLHTTWDAATNTILLSGSF